MDKILLTYNSSVKFIYDCGLLYPLPFPWCAHAVKKYHTRNLIFCYNCIHYASLTNVHTVTTLCMGALISLFLGDEGLHMPVVDSQY